MPDSELFKGVEVSDPNPRCQYRSVRTRESLIRVPENSIAAHMIPVIRVYNAGGNVIDSRLDYTGTYAELPAFAKPLAIQTSSACAAKDPNQIR
jgi:hypothetical protein